jgi:cytochrome P450
MISSYVTHRHPGYWTLPEQFDPDRFLPERAPKANAYVYFPFGGGPRICVGAQFAMMEMQTIMATVVQRYDFDLPATHRLEFDPGLSLRPRRGMFMKIYRRRRN